LHHVEPLLYTQFCLQIPPVIRFACLVTLKGKKHATYYESCELIPKQKYSLFSLAGSSNAKLKLQSKRMSMDFFETIKSRHSIRAFLDKPIEPDKLRMILETIRLAPSAGNLQAYTVGVVYNDTLKKRLAEAALGQDFIAEAPIVLVFFARPDISSARYRGRGADLYCIQDATIVCTYAHLAATALGLGSVWVGAFSEEEVSKILNAPAQWRPIAILPIGYPAEKPIPTSRRPLAQTIVEYH